MILQETCRNVRHAFRIFKRRRAFAAAALFTLVLGIALNTVAFGIVNALWFRPLPFPNGDRLVVLYERNAKSGTRAFTSVPTFRDWCDQSRSFEAMTAVLEKPCNLVLPGSGTPETVGAALIPPGAIEFMGFRPVTGRTLVAGDEGSVVKPVMIGERFWKERFSSDPSVVGRNVVMDGEQATIVGVLPHRFQMLYGGYQVVAPLDERNAGTDRAERSLHVLARLKPGATPEQAQAEMQVVAARIGAAYPASNRDWEVRVADYRRFLFSTAIRMYPMLLTASAFLLLIVCANISNLYLAQAIGRRREIAVRAALGASRAQVVRQMLAEGWLLACAGGALAFVIVVWVRRLLIAGYPELSDLQADFRVFAYTVLVSFIAGTVFGLAPALTASKPDICEVLKAGGRAGQTHGSRRLRRLFVISELAFSLMLLAASGLLVRTVLQLRSAEPGFSTRELLTMQLNLRGARYSTASQRAAFIQLLQQRLAAVPGIDGISVMGRLPLLGGGPPARLEAAGGSGASWQVFVRPVDPYFHEVMKNPLLAGRNIRQTDDAGAEDVVVLNRTAAEKIAPGNARDLLDRHVRINGGAWRRVVGIAEDVRQVLVQPASAEILIPLSREGAGSVWVAARLRSGIAAVSGPLRRELAALDPALPAGSFQTMDDIVAGYFPQVMMIGLLGFSLVALSVAGIGLYGVVASMVAERTHEIGIRIALGAGARTVLWGVLKDSLRMAGWGTSAGLLGAFGLARGMAGLLYGVRPVDPVVFGLVALALLTVVIFSAYLPARRAVRIDPLAALREE